MASVVVQTLLTRDAVGVKLCVPSTKDRKALEHITPVRKLQKNKKLVVKQTKIAGFGFGSAPRFKDLNEKTTPIALCKRSAALFNAWKRKRSSPGISTPGTSTKKVKLIANKQIDSTPPKIKRDIVQTTLDAFSDHTKRILHTLDAMQCRLMCIDFDKTLLDIHTNGSWSATADELVPHIRPLFTSLVPRLHEHGIHLAIATFSPQQKLINELLHLVFGASIAKAIVVRANCTTWSVEAVDGLPEHILFNRKHKLGYLVSSAQALPNKEITPLNTVLIDDDSNNLHAVSEFGVHTVWFEHDDSIASLATKLIPQTKNDSHATPVKKVLPRSERMGRPIKPKKKRTLEY
ncbi:ATP-binding Cassette (ABC) superfamily [Thraustotheca clavata]|uniref:ATP-binding Cassette (ABC) superfamily n=1 Tax=Thraustotheca clavata TaxID=74557 RepID=A0A1W0A109_9STRA|nr:ATP-binding Cassette (ABC) superfamily [Thraustotheca clavata]